MTVCPECGGSGKRWGFNREIDCFDCGGVGEWADDEQPLCMGCDGVLDEDGWCQDCEEFAAVPAELLPENKDRWVA